MEKTKLLAITLLLVKASVGLAPCVIYKVPETRVKVVGVVLARAVLTDNELAEVDVAGEFILTALRKTWVMTLTTSAP